MLNGQMGERYPLRNKWFTIILAATRGRMDGPRTMVETNMLTPLISRVAQLLVWYGRRSSHVDHSRECESVALMTGNDRHVD